MVSVTEASQIIQGVTLTLNTATIHFQESIGRCLAEDIFADRDFPPFNRVAMDGIALHHQHYVPGRIIKIEGMQAAGAPQKKLTDSNNGIEVMTGAILPEGTNTVIRYEDVVIQSGSAEVKPHEVKSWMNIHLKGSDAKQGELLLRAGQLISPAEISLLASVGKSLVKIFEFPRTAVVSTGDELVDVTTQPAPHQIRRSNTYALQATMHQMGWPSNSFHLIDQKEKIRAELKSILENHEVLILSGGVSKGKFDFIPETLTELGVKKLFHQVRQRPGKPFWFGTLQNNKVVFALPGNPVSTFLCFHKYIKPWVCNLMGAPCSQQFVKLSHDFQFQPALTYFLQVSVQNKNGTLTASPLPGGGSGDFVNLKEVNGFIELPAERSDFSSGEAFPYIPFR
jgi:molybdopterin molybdotransferase